MGIALRAIARPRGVFPQIGDHGPALRQVHVELDVYFHGAHEASYGQVVVGALVV